MQPGAMCQLRAAARHVSPLSFIWWVRGVLFAVLLGTAAPARAEPTAGSAEVRAHVEHLVDAAKQRKLDAQPMWWRLLHYRSGLFGVASEADGSPFFNAPDGKTNPQAELAATLRAFFDPGPSDEGLQHPFCRFPARLAWLN